MKEKSRLTAENIFECLTRNESKSGIVATFIENVRPETKNQPVRKHLKFTIPKKEGGVEVRYLTKEKLKRLLFTSNQPKEGDTN